MEKVTRYRHKCRRCSKTFVSASKNPLRCGKCKSPYWDRDKKNNKESDRDREN